MKRYEIVSKVDFERDKELYGYKLGIDIFKNVHYQTINASLEILDDEKIELEGDRWVAFLSEENKRITIARCRVYKHPELDVMITEE